MSYVSEATTATFETEVLVRSENALVLVDFWAEWCGPCKSLAPTLEAAVDARGGAVWLVKVNTDTSPDLAHRWGIRGIPAIKAFRKGRLVNEFMGLKDRRTIDAFIDALLPSPADQALVDATMAVDQRNPQAVTMETLSPALESPHHKDQAKVLLARARLLDHKIEEALEILDAIPAGSLSRDAADKVRIRATLLKDAPASKDMATLQAAIDSDPQAPEPRWTLAAHFYANQDLPQATQVLLDMLAHNLRSFRNDAARLALVALLEEMGPETPKARDFRRQMQIYL